MLLPIILIFISILTVILVLVFLSDRIQARRSLPHGVVKEYWTGKERRKFSRFKTSLEVNYSVEKQTNGKNQGRTIDISDGGMRILIDEKLAKDSILDLQVFDQSSRKIAHVKGVVVWSEEAPDENGEKKRFFYVGLKFVTIHEPQHNSLVEYIRSIAAEDAVLVA